MKCQFERYTSADWASRTMPLRCGALATRSWTAAVTTMTSTAAGSSRRTRRA